MNNIRQIEDDNKLWFRFTKLIFNLACVVLALGYLISWIVRKNGVYRETEIFLPIILCNIGALGLWLLTFWLDHKDIFYLRAIPAVQKKDFQWYKISHYTFFAVFTISLLIYIIIDNTLRKSHPLEASMTIAICVCALTIIPVGVYRYAVWRIEMILAKRRYEEKSKNDQLVIKDKILTSTLTKEEYLAKKQKDDSNPEIVTPTSGLSGGNKK